MNFFDITAQWINENFMGYSGDDVARRIPTYTATDIPVISATQYQSTDKKEQIMCASEMTLMERNKMLDYVSTVSYKHIANTIKEVIINQGFNDFVDKAGIEVSYEDENDKKKSSQFTKDMQIFNKRTKFLELLKDCVNNEGLDNCEFFLSSEVKNGLGIIKIYDDMDIREHIAVYKNTELLGAFNIKTNNSGLDKPTWVDAKNFSHFILNYKKIPLKITEESNFNKVHKIPEKLRVAMPILYPVIDLINQYYQLEQTSTALEILKATQPLLLQMKVNPDQDIEKSRLQLQKWTNALNENRNNIINNLDNFDVRMILSTARKIQLVPYGSDGGDNKLEVLEVDYGNADLSKKLNDIKKTIASAVGIPEYYLAISNVNNTKEDSLLNNPRFSGMLTKIQQAFSNGMRDTYYKHLRYKYMSENGTPLEVIDRDKITISFKSITDLNNRLENEEMMLNVQAAGDLIGLVEDIAASPLINATIEEDEFFNVWKSQTVNNPHVTKMLRKMTEQEKVKQGNITADSDGDGIEDSEEVNKNTKDEESTNKENSDENIRRVFK